MLFHDTSDYVCLSSYYKNESEGNGGRYIFLGRFFSSFRFAGRAPALIYSWSRKCEFLPFSRQRARCTLQWDRRRYHLPGEKRMNERLSGATTHYWKGGKKNESDLASGWNTYYVFFYSVKLWNSSGLMISHPSCTLRLPSFPRWKDRISQY